MHKSLKGFNQLRFYNNYMNVAKLFGILIVVAVACYLRVGVIANTEIDSPIRADAAEYHNYAYNLKYFGVYSRLQSGQETLSPDALRAPGYPVFLMPFIDRMPTDYMLLKINLCQAILGVLTVLFAWSIYKRLMSYRYAFVAAFLTAISPHLVSFTTYLLTETLCTFLLVLSIWFVLLAYERRSLLLACSSGALIAACALTRPTLNYFIVIVCIFMFIQFGNRQGIKYALSIFLGFILIYSPWIVRNLGVIGSATDNSLIINTIHHGMYPDFMYKGLTNSKGFPYRFDPESPQISANIMSLKNELFRRFLNEPRQHLNWFLVGKPIAFFSWGVVNGWGDIFIYPVIKTPYANNTFYIVSRLFMYWTHEILILLSICACVAVWLPNTAKSFDNNKLVTSRLLSLLVLYFLAIHIIGAPFPRYSVPLRPFNYGMAIFSLSFIVARALSLKSLYKNNYANK
jgi:4-amino-4-deoxy-L-arabinose transferase-like glycosyltransferase